MSETTWAELRRQECWGFWSGPVRTAQLASAVAAELVYRHLNAASCCGLTSTGKYRKGDEAKIDPPPHLTCDSFPQAVEHVLRNLLVVD